MTAVILVAGVIVVACINPVSAAVLAPVLVAVAKIITAASGAPPEA